MRQPAFAKVTAKSYWNTVQLKWRAVLADIKFHQGKVGVRHLALNLADIQSVWRKALSFLERCSASFLNSITQLNAIRSAEKVNAQCISNEAFLIALL